MTFAHMQSLRRLLHQRPGLLRNFQVKIYVSNKDFQTWHLIGLQHSRQPIRSHVRKSLLTNMEFNMDFTYDTVW